MNSLPASHNSLSRMTVRLLLAGTLLGTGLTSLPSEAQKAAKPSSVAVATAATPLTTQESAALDSLFTRVRPATLRIEECEQTRCSEPDGIGSAVLIGEGGLALTAYHVVFQAGKLTAVTSDKKRYDVKVVGYDDQHDLAVLKVNVPGSTPYLPLAKAAPGVGDPVLAVGNGGGEFLRPQTGRLLGLNAEAGRADFPPGTLQVSAQLIPGDSGGPLLNAAGEVMGIVSFIHADDGKKGDLTNITAYAVPVTASDARLAELKSGVKRDAPIIGVSLGGNYGVLASLPKSLFAEANQRLNLQLGNTPGAFFTAVVPGSPAAKAGLQPLRYDQNDKRRSGDLVTAVNGTRVNNFSEFQAAVRQYAPGDTVKLSVLRGGKPITLDMTLVGRASLNN